MYYLTFIVVYIAGTAKLTKGVNSDCPHEVVTGLQRWSDSGTWPNNQPPTAGENVSISTAVLLDVSPPELFGITIESTGRLVWSPEKDIELVVKFILIKGRFDIGSEGCPFTAKATVTLIGERLEYRIPKFNEKFVGVDAGGTFEVHGKNKLSWTKLNVTLPSIYDSGGLLFNFNSGKSSHYNKWFEGLRFVVVYRNGTEYDNKMFYTSGSDDYWTERTMEEIMDFVNGIPDDLVVLAAVQHRFINYHEQTKQGLETVYQAIESVAGISPSQSVLRNVGEYDTYVMATIKGDPSTTKEAINPVDIDKTSFSTASLRLDDVGLRFSADSFIHTAEDWLSYCEFRVSTIDVSYPILTLAEDASSWEEGDKIIITSTDFDRNQIEEALVVKFFNDNLLPNQVRVDLEARFMHFGEIEKEVDMRAEVALISRNILFQGRMSDTCPPSNNNCGDYDYDTFGGHFKVIVNFTNVHVEGAEFYHMGQQTEVGHYPVHFHMALDVDDPDKYPNPPYIRENVVHHSFARCYTVHGTNGLTLMDNVGYDSLGHCYFLEDCGEKRTVLDGNLGVITRQGSIIPSDSDPTTFWVTNPNTIVKNNVAAGSELFGFWFIYCDVVGGLSKDKGFMAEEESRYTALTEFSNNAAHSNEECGFLFDDRTDINGNVIGGNAYAPREIPLDPNSADKEVKIHRMTAFKNSGCNAWLTGGYFNVTRASFADSITGLTFARSSHQIQFMQDSVFLGESSNIGNPEPGSVLTRSTPYPWDVTTPQTGFVFYDGPVYVENVYCDKYKTNQHYPMGCLSFKRENQFPSSPVSSTKGMSFGYVDGPNTGNRVYDGNETANGFANLDGDKSATFRDIDGTVTTLPGSQVVKPGAFYGTEECFYRSNWGMQYCPYKHGKFNIEIRSEADKFQNGNPVTIPFMLREDIPTVIETQTGKHSIQFMAILGGEFSYQLHWNKTIPSEFEIFVAGVESGQSVRIGICLPLDAVFDLYSYSPRDLDGIAEFDKVSSVDDVDQDNMGGKYFHDVTSGMLYLKFLKNGVLGDAEPGDCPGEDCPMMRIHVTGGDRQDADCTARTTPSPPQTQTKRKRRAVDLSFDDVKEYPDVGQGAGSMKPFVSRIPINGGFGEWSLWSQCSKICGGGLQERTRQCNNPIPANGGSMCDESYVEHMDCNLDPCPINGGFTEWSDWSPCIQVTQCSGYQTRNRSCTQPTPNYGGQFCNGNTDQVQACQVPDCPSK